jgi:hypothetical protein
VVLEVTTILSCDGTIRARVTAVDPVTEKRFSVERSRAHVKNVVDLDERRKRTQ